MWGSIRSDSVIQVAAQTLEAFFTGGGQAREHNVYPLADVALRAPVLRPPSIRFFDEVGSFTFANPTAVRSPGSEIPRPGGRLDAAQRLAAVIGADGVIAGWTGLVEWRAPGLAAPKDRDFALLLGPAVETEHEDGFDWEAARALAAANTRLRPGDLLAGPVLELHEGDRERRLRRPVRAGSASSPRSSAEPSSWGSRSRDRSPAAGRRTRRGRRASPRSPRVRPRSWACQSESAATLPS